MVLTKADLCENIAEKIAAVKAVAVGLDSLVNSVIEQDGCGQILPYIQKGQTVALIGSSGVGKPRRGLPSPNRGWDSVLRLVEAQKRFSLVNGFSFQNSKNNQNRVA